MDDDALNRAKRALAVVPRAGDDALSRAKRALTPADNGAKLDGLLERARAAARPNAPPAGIAKDATRIDDLLAQARKAALPVERKPAPPADPPRAIVHEHKPAKIDPPEEAPRNPPPAVIPSAPSQAVTPAPQPAAAQPAETPVQAAAPVQQTIVVQVAAPYPAYPYGYPYPYWSHPYYPGCPHWNCPLRSGLPCRRWRCW